MSESLRNDGRIWVPKKKEDAEAIRAGKMKPTQIAEDDRDYYLERRYPAFGNLVPRDVASRAAKERCDAGYGVGATGLAVYLDFKSSIERLGQHTIEERYGNLFQMYEKIVDENPYETPMMIYPAIHYTMGGRSLVDYELQTNIPGLFAARRSQLLRSRCKPFGSFGFDAGFGRWLFRFAIYYSRIIWLIILPLNE